MISMRAATIADLQAIVALDQAIFGAYGADEDPAIIAARLATFEAGCKVIVDSDQILAYLTAEKWRERRAPALDEDPRTTHDPQGTILNITTLAVDPRFQGQGLGRQLLRAAEAIAQQEGCHEIILETARARDFYLRHGYTQTGERVQRGIRLHVMAFSLMPPTSL